MWEVYVSGLRIRKCLDVSLTLSVLAFDLEPVVCFPACRSSPLGCNAALKIRLHSSGYSGGFQLCVIAAIAALTAPAPPCWRLCAASPSSVGRRARPRAVLPPAVRPAWPASSVRVCGSALRPFPSSQAGPPPSDRPRSTDSSPLGP